MASQKTPITTELAQKNKVQTKIPNTTGLTDGELLAQFNNLTVGKLYTVYMQAFITINQGDDLAGVSAVHDGTQILEIKHNVKVSAERHDVHKGTAGTFKATQSTLDMFAIISGNGRVKADGTRKRGTFIQIEERNDLEETTDFT